MRNLTLENEAGFDESLMHDVIRQDARALEELYERHRPLLRGVVLRVLNDEVEAEDILQEVFLQLWTRADDYSAAKGKPLGWLITLARRRAIDRVRQRCAYERATDRFEVESRRSAGQGCSLHTVESAAFRDELRDIVTKALLRLPPKQKVVIERAFLDGMSQREIASAMCLPLGTVKTRIDLGLRKLASVLAGVRRTIF